MDHFNLSSLLLVAPEGCIFILIIALQLLATFGKLTTSCLRRVYIISLAMAVLWLSLMQPEGLGFNQMYQADNSVCIYKSYILLSTIMVLCSFNFKTYQDIKGLSSEYLSIMMLASLGGMLAVAAKNFIFLFLALELQSLATYILVSTNLSSIRSAEAGVKYFTLGSLMSCFFLLGISLLYGLSGSLYFNNIAQNLELLDSYQNIAGLIALILIISNFLFKLAVSPWHFWVPDVYQGAPTNVLAFLSSVPKITALALIIQILSTFSPHIVLVDILRATAILSMIVGTLGGIRQTSIKRLLAYSAIADVGYLLIMLICRSFDFIMLYLMTYIISILGILALLASISTKATDDITLKDIAGLAKTHKKAALGIALISFSLAGIPPLVGFFLKFYVITVAMANHEYWLIAVALASSVVAAYYYLKIVRSLYFVEGHVQNNLIFSFGTKIVSIFAIMLILGIVLAFILQAILLIR